MAVNKPVGDTARKGAVCKRAGALDELFSCIAAFAMGGRARDREVVELIGVWRHACGRQCGC